MMESECLVLRAPVKMMKLPFLWKDSFSCTFQWLGPTGIFCCFGISALSSINSSPSNTSLRDPSLSRPACQSCLRVLGPCRPKNSTDLDEYFFWVRKCEQIAPCQRGSLQLELISSLKESVASLASLAALACGNSVPNIQRVVEKISPGSLGVPHLSCRWFCCLPLSLVNASAWEGTARNVCRQQGSCYQYRVYICMVLLHPGFLFVVCFFLLLFVCFLQQEPFLDDCCDALNTGISDGLYRATVCLRSQLVVRRRTRMTPTRTTKNDDDASDDRKDEDEDYVIMPFCLAFFGTPLVFGHVEV